MKWEDKIIIIYSSQNSYRNTSMARNVMHTYCILFYFNAMIFRIPYIIIHLIVCYVCFMFNIIFYILFIINIIDHICRSFGNLIRFYRFKSNIIPIALLSSCTRYDAQIDNNWCHWLMFKNILETFDYPVR